MDFKQLFAYYRTIISERIQEVLSEKQTEFDERMHSEVDVFETLRSFSTKGKLLRGSLFLLSVNSYKKETSKELLNIAASLELMHSALLIHDDIMDNDTLRRGEKTVFAKYKDQARNLKIQNADHFGISMGIVVGDIALFIAEELAAYADQKNLQKLLQFYTRELRIVGIGQLLDFQYGALSKEFDGAEIQRMYIDKSARYSFTLPLCLGAIAAEMPDSQIQMMEKLGEKIGLIFQLIDDDIGIFGSESKIGKPIGSDIRENKKTFMRSLLIKKASPEERKYLEEIFGNPSLKNQDVLRIREMTEELGVRSEIQSLIENLYNESQGIIGQLEISPEYKDVYKTLLDYNTKRTF